MCPSVCCALNSCHIIWPTCACAQSYVSHILACVLDKIAECNCACVDLCCAGLNEVVLRFHKTKIIRIRPNGDFMLTSGGWLTATTGQSRQAPPLLRYFGVLVSDREHRYLPMSFTDVY